MIVFGVAAFFASGLLFGYAYGYNRATAKCEATYNPPLRAWTTSPNSTAANTTYTTIPKFHD